jgi:hypothetical protein
MQAWTPSGRQVDGRGLVHIWSTTHRNPTVASGRQRSPAVHHSRRCQVRSWGNRPGGRTLIRMKSEVQLLPGPPPVPAGQSAAGLGRAGAARPAPPAHPVAPPGPPTRASGSTTTTHRGRAPSPRTAATRHAATSRCSLLPCPQRSRPRRALRTPAWPAWSLSGQARPPRPAPTPAARVRHRPPTGHRDFGSVARVPASATVDRAVDGPAAPGAATGSGDHGRPATATWSHRHRLRWEETDASGRGGHGTAGQRTGGHRTGGQRTGGQQTAERRTLWTTPQVTGQRTAGQPDPGRRDRMGGHRMLDTGDRCRGLPAGRVDHGDDARPLDTGWTLLRANLRLGEQQPGRLSSKDAEGTHAATDGSGHRRDRQLQVVRRPAGALAHCSPRTISSRA